MTNEEIKTRLEALKKERKAADALVQELLSKVNAAQARADALYNEEFNLIGKMEELEAGTSAPWPRAWG